MCTVSKNNDCNLLYLLQQFNYISLLQWSLAQWPNGSPCRRLLSESHAFVRKKDSIILFSCCYILACVTTGIWKRQLYVNNSSSYTYQNAVYQIKFHCNKRLTVEHIVHLVIVVKDWFWNLKNTKTAFYTSMKTQTKHRIKTRSSSVA